MDIGIDKIEIVLENCEVVTIEAKHIGEFLMSEIKTSFKRRGMNHIDEIKSTELFALSINRNANTKDSINLFGLDSDYTSFHRLTKYNDITAIYIYKTNEEQPMVVYVNWHEEYDQNNKYQKTYINEFGDLFLVINKESDIFDIFYKEEIEDKEYMDFVWSMYDMSE